MATQTKRAKKSESLVQVFVKSAKARLAELQPMLDEAEEIRVTLARVEGTKKVASTPTPSITPRKKQKRNRKGGRRADQFVKIVQANPGVKASDIAREMGIKPNYVYRLASEVTEEGQVKKENGRYVPA